jgi:hypothetical protein
MVLSEFEAWADKHGWLLIINPEKTQITGTSYDRVYCTPAGNRVLIRIDFKSHEVMELLKQKSY